MRHRDWLLATRTRDRLRAQWRNLFKEFDVILCPVMPTLSFPHDHTPDPDVRHLEVDGTAVSYSHQYTWVSIATLLGLPATAIPIGQSETGLPIGIQIIGDYLEDKTTIEFAKFIEREFGGFTPPAIDLMK
jgi:amidase